MTGPDLDPRLSASMRRTILEHVRASTGRRRSPRQVVTALGGIALVAGVTAAAVVIIVAGLPGFGTPSPIANTPPTSATASPTPSPRPTSTPTPTTPSTPTPPPSATPPPEPGSGTGYDPADMGTWRITFEGVGPISLGTPLSEVVDRIPSEAVSCRPAVEAFFGYSVVAVAGDDDPDAPVALAVVAFSSQVPADATRPSTAEGITYGSTVDEVLAAYPDAEEYTTSMGERAYRITDGSSYIHFLTFGQPTIQAIMVNRAPTTPKEYCG